MSEVKDLRVALERLREGLHPQSCCNVERALVSEGLAACDRYESCLRPAIIDSWSKMAIQTNGDQVTLIASILRKARLL